MSVKVPGLLRYSCILLMAILLGGVAMYCLLPGGTYRKKKTFFAPPYHPASGRNLDL